MADYTTIAKVQAFLPTDVRIDASTEPTYAQVAVWITAVTAELDVALVAGGATAQTTDANQLLQFDLIAAMQVAWLVLVAKDVLRENAVEHPYHTMYTDLIATLAPDPALGESVVVHSPWSYTMDADPDDVTDALGPKIRKDQVF